MRKKSRKGFSFVEMLIVVAIIAILAVIAIPNMLRARVDAHDTVAQATLKSIAVALETYLASYHVYPTDPNNLINVNPPYLNKDYFTGMHQGFNFSHNLSAYSYSITATPVSMGSTGTRSYTITTGAVLTAH